MDRRRFLVTSLAGALAAGAQPAGKRWRVGYLSAGFTRPGGLGSWDVFRTALRDLGYVEGQNLVLDARHAEGRMDRIPRLASEIVGLGPDVVVATGSAETQAVKDATTVIPIVMVVVPEAVGSGLVLSLGRPGGNVTGLTSTPGLELQGKRLALLRELVPAAVKVAYLANPGVPATAARVQATEAAARALGVQMRIMQAQTPDGLRDAFSLMRQQRVEALLVPTDPLFLNERHRLAELSISSRLPVMYDVREYVEAGGLAAYGPVFLDLFRRAAGYVDRLLKGHKAADLPVEQPTKFELVLNVKTAKALGLTIPPSLLARADQVIE
jgi:putative ABC transport system substrate-binding protein